ncbi:DinB family protein [bacterium SCSIO 12643]|nr:DinB family protein [bacterium SCSIO 12643]
MSKFKTPELISDLKGKTEFCIKEAKKLLKQDLDTLNYRPNPETWSAAQCLDHLVQYGDFYLPEITSKIQEEESLPVEAFKSGFIGNMFANSMLHKPGMTKMQSPGDKVPLHSSYDKEIINTFIDQQKEYLDLIKKSENINLNKPKIRISISKFVKLKLGDALRVNIYHNERHVLQALRAIKNAN